MSRSRRLSVGLAVGAAMLSIASASAQANWGPPNDAIASKLTCSNYTPLWHAKFQECILVTPTTGGASVQSITAVSASASDFVTASTATHISGQSAVSSQCAGTWMGLGQRLWCWGQTKFVGHGHTVQGSGQVDEFYGISGVAWSPVRTV